MIFKEVLFRTLLAIMIRELTKRLDMGWGRSWTRAYLLVISSWTVSNVTEPQRLRAMAAGCRAHVVWVGIWRLAHEAVWATVVVCLV